MRSVSIDSRVLKTLFTVGPSSRTEIAQTTGLNPATVTRVTQELLERGYIREGGERVNRPTPGRRAIELHLRTDTLFAAGVVVNAYEQKVVLTDLTGRVATERVVPREPDQTASRTLADFAGHIESLAANAGIAAENLVGVGIACAGVVDAESRRVLNSPDIGWFDVEVATPFETRLGVPVLLETMQNTVNVAERSFGRAAGAENAMLVSIALGIGSSLILGNQLIRRTANAASTFGHMPVVGGEELCNCGRRGCLTTLASGYAVLRELDLVDPYRKPGSHAPAYAALLTQTLDKARAGEQRIGAALTSAGHALGDALKASVSVVMPDAIILAGPVARMAAYSTAVANRLAPSARDPYGWQGELIVSRADLATAAARLALERFVYDDGNDASPSGIHDSYKSNGSHAANTMT